MSSENDKPPLKNLFPFSNYDFYGYISCGTLLAATIDYVFNDGRFIFQTSWTVPQIVFAVSVAYILGHIAAAPSSALFEQVICRKILSPPLRVQLAMQKREFIGSLLAVVFAHREYAPLPAQFSAIILRQARSRLGLDDSQTPESESIFLIAFKAARENEDARQRLDDFRNLYGFSRNASMAFLMIFVLFFFKSAPPGESLHYELLAVFSAICCIGMFGRFLKFYSAFSSECIRALAGVSPPVPLDKV